MIGMYKPQLQIANECGVNLREVSAVIRKLKIVGFKRVGSAKTVYTPKQQSLIQAKLNLDGKTEFLTLPSKLNTMSEKELQIENWRDKQKQKNEKNKLQYHLKNKQ